MAYYRYPPHPALAQWVEYLWVQESLSPWGEAPPTTIVPGGRLELVVHYWEPFEKLVRGRPRTLPMAFLLGQRTEPIQVRGTGRTGLMIVGFHPWVGTAVLPNGAPKIVDDLVSIDTLDRPLGSRSLTARIDEASSREQRLAVLEAHLLRAFEGMEPDPLAMAAIGHLQASRGRLPIAELARELGISRRQLHRRLSLAVGLAPKRFGRLLRFQHALGTLRAGGDWADAVERCGLVDQAHLARELKAFCGRTPEQLRRASSTPLMRAYNARNQKNGLYNTVYL